MPDRKPASATVGGAHGILERYARLLESKGEKPAVARSIRTMLAWREKVLIEKYGFQPRNFSVPSMTNVTGDQPVHAAPVPQPFREELND